MTNWKEKIEAQIAEMRQSASMSFAELDAVTHTAADTMQALLDFAVAAEPILKRFPLVTNDMNVRRFRDALNKLREANDD